MKKYYAYVAKDVASYFETKLAECGVRITKRKLVLVNDGEVLYYYVVEAKDGIIDSKFEIERAQALSFDFLKMKGELKNEND